MKFGAPASILMALVVMSSVASGEMLKHGLGDGLSCYCTQSMGQAQQNRYYYCNYNRVQLCTTGTMETEEYGSLTVRGMLSDKMSYDCGKIVNETYTTVNPFFKDNDDLLFITVKSSTIQCCDTPLCNE